MLEVSSLRSPSNKAAAVDPRRGGFVVVGDHAGFLPTSAGTVAVDDDDFLVDDDNLLDYIDFSSCCDMPFFDADGDILPDLEVDPTESLLAEFSSPSPETTPPNPPPPDEEQAPPQVVAAAAPKEAADDIDGGEKEAAAVTTTTKQQQHKAGDEVASTTLIITEEEEEQEDSGAGSSDAKSSSSAAAGGHSSNKKKASAAGKDSNGKRKVKVDWTPELHRRFVQAVEQLGIDKAVPSRILEIMGIEGLTRHNIASHLQKYRSHRKHLMAREAEAATWAQKRQLYAAAPVARKAVEAAAAVAGPPWVVPTLGFPPPPPAAMAPHPPPFCRPLHVWGHPPTTCAAAAAVEAPGAATMLPVWPRHLAPPRAWVDPGYWHQHQQQQYNARTSKWAPAQAAAVTQGTPCVPPPPAAMHHVQLAPRFPHPSMYSRPPVNMNMMVPPPPPPPAAPPTMMMTTTTKLAELQLQLDAHPSKESIDAAIGDVLVKPWLPLPLGLKPPSLDSVMSELHKHGIPKIPPAAS